MAAAEAEESRARRGREEGGGTCYNATHEAVVANGNEQDDRREGEAGWMFMFASKTRKCSVITTWIARRRTRPGPTTTPIEGVQCGNGSDQ